MGYALRFIAGNYMGGEFPLRPNREIVIGRGSEFDMVLDEDMVSRRHAKIATYHGQIVFQDLKSTNGSFVNGERITVARLRLGDKLLVGTSIMELVEQDAGPTAVSQVPSDTPTDLNLNVPLPDQLTTEGSPVTLGIGAPVATARPTIDRAQGMSGRFPDDDVTVADLVELFTGNGRSGVLVLQDSAHTEGRIFFRDGQIYFATLAYAGGADGGALLGAEKCLFRLLTWREGEFRMDALKQPPEFDQPISGETRHLLIEGLRQWDELQVYADHVPPRGTALRLRSPLVSRLSALSAEALDTLQLVLNHGEVGRVLDHSPASDLETTQDLLYLLQNGYVEPA